MKDKYLRNTFLILDILSFSRYGCSKPLCKVRYTLAVELLWLMSDPCCHIFFIAIIIQNN